MLISDLRTQAIDLVIAARDAHNLRPVNLGAENLGWLEIGRDEDPRLEAIARGLGRDRVGEVAGRRARNGIESKRARLCQRHGDHAILETERGQADGVVLDAELAGAEFFREVRRAQ